MIRIEDMLYFSNNKNNVDVALELGVVSFPVKNGMTMHDLLNGLKLYAEVKMVI